MKKVVFVLFLIGISSISAAPRCKCNCSGYSPICARNVVTKETLTFKNQCQLDCQNCTSGTSYVIIRTGECPNKQRKPLALVSFEEGYTMPAIL